MSHFNPKTLHTKEQNDKVFSQKVWIFVFFSGFSCIVFISIVFLLLMRIEKDPLHVICCSWPAISSLFGFVAFIYWILYNINITIRIKWSIHLPVISVKLFKWKDDDGNKNTIKTLRLIFSCLSAFYFIIERKRSQFRIKTSSKCMRWTKKSSHKSKTPFLRYWQ